MQRTNRSVCRLALVLSLAATLAACSSAEKTEETAAPAQDSAAAEPDAAAPAADSAAPAEAEPEPAAAEPAVIDGITNKRLSFAPGASGTTVEGSIKGYETIDYLLNVKAGQSLNISLGTKHTATYFNLLEPGETEVAIFNGSMAENAYEGKAAKSGDYRIRVYMLRSAARRDEKADYRLEANVSA